MINYQNQKVWKITISKVRLYNPTITLKIYPVLLLKDHWIRTYPSSENDILWKKSKKKSWDKHFESQIKQINDKKIQMKNKKGIIHLKWESNFGLRLYL
jgi:hypothetical protein